MTNLDYICLFLYDVSTYLYNKQLNITDTTYYAIANFLSTCELDIVSKLAKNVLKTEDFYNAYQKLIDEYKVVEHMTTYFLEDGEEMTAIYLQFNEQKKLLSKFSKEDLAKVDTLAWLYYNEYLGLLKKVSQDDNLKIGSYDASEKINKFYKN